MDRIALSIEELIYCYYNQGLYEQGNALREVYLEGVPEEQVELLLQTVCRSLMSKGVLSWERHTFILRQDVADIVASLNYSDHTIRLSKHRDEGEESVSFHLSDKGIFQHTLEFEGQVHVFEKVGQEVIEETTRDLFGFRQEGAASPSRTISLSRHDFETMLACIDGRDESAQQWEDYLRGCSAELRPFAEIMGQSKGLMNTLAIMEFTHQGEPVVRDVLLFPHGEQADYMIAKVNETFVITECDVSVVRERMLLSLGVRS